MVYSDDLSAGTTGTLYAFTFDNIIFVPTDTAKKIALNPNGIGWHI